MLGLAHDLHLVDSRVSSSATELFTVRSEAKEGLPPPVPFLAVVRHAFASLGQSSTSLASDHSVLGDLVTGLSDLGSKYADDSSAAPAVAQTSEIDRVLSQGQAFENNRRWAEALTLYEEASRRYPKTQEIEERLELARIHYDLSRRYADNSFRRTLLTLSEQEALELYNQVLSRVYAHSVSNPDWAGLIRRGTIDLQIALADKQFSEYHLRGRDENAIRQLQSDIAQLTRTAPVDRVAAKTQVQQIARLANQRIAISPLL